MKIPFLDLKAQYKSIKPEINDAIQQGENGYLLETGNAETFQRKIESTLAEPADRVTFGKKARNYVTKHQAWPLIASRYQHLLEVLVTGS